VQAQAGHGEEADEHRPRGAVVRAGRYADVVPAGGDARDPRRARAAPAAEAPEEGAAAIVGFPWRRHGGLDFARKGFLFCFLFAPLQS
jgi:hypothetical protein